MSATQDPIAAQLEKRLKLSHERYLFNPYEEYRKLAHECATLRRLCAEIISLEEKDPDGIWCVYSRCAVDDNPYEWMVKATAAARGEEIPNE